MLRELAIQTGESASFYVREGGQRICLVRVEGPQAIRHHVRIGAALPLDSGSRDASSWPSPANPANLRNDPPARLPPLAGRTRARSLQRLRPVFGLHWRLLGSMCISGPTARLDETRLTELAQTVMDAANRLSYAMAGSQREPMQIGRPATWHP